MLRFQASPRFSRLHPPTRRQRLDRIDPASNCSYVSAASRTDPEKIIELRSLAGFRRQRDIAAASHACYGDDGDGQPT